MSSAMPLMIFVSSTMPYTPPAYGEAKVIGRVEVRVKSRVEIRVEIKVRARGLGLVRTRYPTDGEGHDGP